MKRYLSLALVLGSFSLVGFVGCGEEAKVSTESKVETPEGTKTVTDEKKIETTGDMKPSAEPVVEAPK